MPALLEHPLGVAVKGRVRLDRETALAPTLAREDRLENRRPADGHLLDDRQVISTSVQVGCSSRMARTRGRQTSSSFFMTSPTIVGFEVAPTAPLATAYSSSATAQESFQ